MKKLLPIFLFLLATNLVVAQEEKVPELLTTPSGWRAEFIPFPISFAPSLAYVGVEDVRFSKGWGTEGTEDFFTYAFLWYLDEDPDLSVPKLNADFNTYFDGLMVVVAGSNDSPKTKTDFKKTSKGYNATIEIYDAFFTKKQLTLNATVVTSYCSKTKKYMVLFNLSPKKIGGTVWKKFDELKINIDCSN